MLQRKSPSMQRSILYRLLSFDFTTFIFGFSQIWDTAGQERYRAINHSLYNGSSVIVVVYDITDRQSFRDVGIWMDDISKVLFVLVCSCQP
jgi:signal recognition particle receptor subunit beta